MADLPARVLHGIDQGASALRSEFTDQGVDLADPRVILAMAAECEAISAAFNAGPLQGSLMMAAIATLLRGAWADIETPLPPLPD